MPILYGLPTIVSDFDVSPDGLSIWSSWGFAYHTGASGNKFCLLLDGSDEPHDGVEEVVAPLGKAVITRNGHYIAPRVPQQHLYEAAMQCYLQRFPEREFDYYKIHTFFFPDAVTIVDYIDYEHPEKNYVFHYSLQNGSVEDLESPNIGWCLISPCGICVHQAPMLNKYVAVDSRLNELWQMDFKYFGISACPLDITRGSTADTVLLNLGYVDVKDQYGRDNEVALVELATGQCRWQVTFPEVVNSIWSDKQYVYVSSQGSAFVLNAATGEIVKRLDKVFSIDSNRARYHPQDLIYGSVLKSVFVSDGRHLYLFNTSHLSSTSNTSGEFWIYDADTLECLRHEDLPQGYTVHREVEARVLNGKLYVPLKSTFWGNAGGALAEFDPDDIHSDFVLDVTVPFEESIRQNGKAQEYVLTTHHPSLDDILRYGEPELINLGVLRGRCTFSKKVKNPAFNGVIHLAIDRAAMQPEADQKLAVLLKRLNAWGQSGHYASDGKTKISFRWEWL